MVTPGGNIPTFTHVDPEAVTWATGTYQPYYVYVASHQSVQCVIITSWGYSNLRQEPLRNYAPSLTFTTLNLALPPHLFQPFCDNSSSLLHPTATPSAAISWSVMDHIVMCILLNRSYDGSKQYESL